MMTQIRRLRYLYYLSALFLSLVLGACTNFDAEPANLATSTSSVLTFSESGVYRIPNTEEVAPEGSGTLHLGQHSIPMWQTDATAESIRFFYAPVTTTRSSEVSALFWEPQADVEVVAPASLMPLSVADAQSTAEQLYWQEEDNSYQSEADMELPWLWTRVIAPGEWQDTITVPVGTTAPYTLTVRLWAQTAMPANPDHHVQLLWDDVLVGDETWDGEGIYTLFVPLPDTASGQHTLTVVAPGDTDALADVIHVDGWGLAFQRPLDIRQEPATWSATATAARIQVNPNQPLWLLDITDPLEPLAFGPAIPDASELTVATQPGHRYWAGNIAQIPFPPGQRPRQTLTEDERQALTIADYIVVGDEPYLAAAQPLIDYRQSAGLHVATLTPLQLFDTWGGGIPGVDALPNFMDWRRTQGQLPDYLLLLGDADLAPWASDEEALAQRLPTAFVPTTYIGETPSDVALLGEDTGTVAVGRIPARTVAEVEAVVKKTLEYERSSKSRNHLILNDDDAEFDIFATGIAATWQEQGDETQRFVAGAPEGRNDVLTALKQGPAWLHYVGHGSPLLWSKNQVLTANDASVWSDPAIVFAWTCLSGYFTLPDNRSLAEQWLLSPDGGAVAVIAPTAEDITANQQPFANAVYQTLSESDTLGAALTQVRNEWQQQEMVWQYHLFGDPALTVNP